MTLNTHLLGVIYHTCTCMIPAIYSVIVHSCNFRIIIYCNIIIQRTDVIVRILISDELPLHPEIISNSLIPRPMTAISYCQRNILTNLYCVEWHNTIFTRSGLLSVHKLFTSCIRRCSVSSTCDWVMSALLAALLIFSLQFSRLFFHISVARLHQHCGVILALIGNIGHRTLPKIWVGTFLCGTYIPGERLWVDYNGKN